MKNLIIGVIFVMLVIGCKHESSGEFHNSLAPQTEISRLHLSGELITCKLTTLMIYPSKPSSWADYESKDKWIAIGRRKGNVDDFLQIIAKSKKTHRIDSVSMNGLKRAVICIRASREPVGGVIEMRTSGLYEIVDSFDLCDGGYCPSEHANFDYVQDPSLKALFEEKFMTNE